MKKIVFIVFTLLISLQAYSQSKLKKGYSVGEADDLPVVDSITDDGTRLKNYVDGAIKPMWNDANDSVPELRTDIDGNTSTGATLTTSTEDLDNSVEVLETNTSGVANWTMEITDDGDSLKFTYGSSIIKIASDSKTVPDTQAPSIETVEVGNLATDTVVITYDEALNGDSICATTAFTFTTSLGDGSAIVDNILISGDTVKLTLDSAILQTETVGMSYTRPATGRLQDAAGNLVVSSSGVSVETNITSDQIVHSLFRFENNLTNEVLGGVTLEQGGATAPSYNTGATVPEGTYSLNLTTSTAWVESDAAVTFPEEWTMGVWVYDGSETVDESPLFSVENYLDVYVDYKTNTPTDHINVKSFSGGTQIATSTGSNISWTNAFVVIRYMNTGGTDHLTIWLDGVNVTSDSTLVADCSSMVGTLRIGKTSGVTGNTDLDAFNFYKTALTDAQIVTLSGATGTIIGDQYDPDDDNWTVIWSHDFDDLDPVVYDRETYDIDDDPGWARVYQSSTYNCDYLGMSIYGSDTVLTTYYDEGCCGAYENTYCPCRTGTYFTAYFHSDLSGYNDVYFSFNMATSSGFYPGAAYDGTNYVGAPAGESHEMKMLGVGSENSTSSTSSMMRVFWDGYNNKPTSNDGDNSFFLNIKNALSRPNATTQVIPRDGTWENYTIRVSTNTSGSSNGIIELFRGGVLVWSSGGWDLVSNGETINKIVFGPTVGGSGIWDRMEAYGEVYWDDLTVWTTTAVDRGEASTSGRALNMPDECELDK